MATSSRTRRAALVGAAFASVFLLSACAPPTAPVQNYPGAAAVDHAEEAESGHADPTEGLTASWLNQGGKVAVTISGSSSCPTVGTDIRVVEPAGSGNTVEIIVADQPEDQACTMDFAPHTTEFWTPMNITTTEKLTVMVGDESTTVPIK